MSSAETCTQKKKRIGKREKSNEETNIVCISNPFQKIVLWGCRHVTEEGLLVLVSKCRKLESINVWGLRVPLDCFVSLLTISPALQIHNPRES